MSSGHRHEWAESASDADLPGILGRVHEGILLVDAAGSLTYLNPIAAQWLGVAPDDAVGQPLPALIAQPGDSLVVALYTDAKRHGGASQVEGFDGSSQRWVQASVYPTAHGWAVHVRDLGPFHQTEATPWLAAIVESSQDAIWSKSLDGRITSWNPAAERLYGYTAMEAVGHHISIIMPPERQNELPAILARLLRGEPTTLFETERKRKDGTRIEVSISFSPVRDGQGRIVGAAVVARDISERRELERRRQEFLTMVAHDLRSPLTAIKGFTQLMQRRGTYQEAAIATILAQINHMERLVDDVLDVMRMDEGRLELRLAPVDLIALAAAGVRQVQASTTRHQLRLDAAAASLMGEWDADRIDQILENLLTNAVKYTPGGEIVVHIARQDQQVTVSVSDQGPGISAEALAKIFDRFYRGTQGSRTIPGTGLGLTITKSLVETLGGQIWVTSTLGEGTTFTFTLPQRSGANP